MELDDLLSDLVPDAAPARGLDRILQFRPPNRDEFSGMAVQSSPAPGSLWARRMSEPDDELLRDLLPDNDSVCPYSLQVPGRAEDKIPGPVDRLGRLGLPRGARTPSPSSDPRGPVEDDYDVVAATASFAARRPGDRCRHAHADLAERRELLLRQADRLQVAEAHGTDSHRAPIRAHYARVRCELLAEAEALEAKLATEVDMIAKELVGQFSLDFPVEVPDVEPHQSDAREENTERRHTPGCEVSKPGYADSEELAWEGC